MAKTKGDTVGIVERVRGWLRADEPDEVYWPRIRELVEAGEIDDATETLARRGLAPDVVELVAIVIAEVKRLEAAIAAGNVAAPRLRSIERELETLARVTASDAASAVQVATKQAELRNEASRLAHDVSQAEASHHPLVGINQAFNLLWGRPTARAITGGSPNALRQWFFSRGLSMHLPGSWQSPRMAPEPTKTKLVALPSN